MLSEGLVSGGPSAVAEVSPVGTLLSPRLRADDAICRMLNTTCIPCGKVTLPHLGRREAGPK